jgi:hypothetical protein
LVVGERVDLGQCGVWAEVARPSHGRRVPHGVTADPARGRGHQQADHGAAAAQCGWRRLDGRADIRLPGRRDAHSQRAVCDYVVAVYLGPPADEDRATSAPRLLIEPDLGEGLINQIGGRHDLHLPGVARIDEFHPPFAGAVAADITRHGGRKLAAGPHQRGGDRR